MTQQQQQQEFNPKDFTKHEINREEAGSFLEKLLGHTSTQEPVFRLKLKDVPPDHKFVIYFPRVDDGYDDELVYHIYIVLYNKNKNKVIEWKFDLHLDYKKIKKVITDPFRYLKIRQSQIYEPNWTQVNKIQKQKQLKQITLPVLFQKVSNLERQVARINQKLDKLAPSSSRSSSSSMSVQELI